ncbi:MAG TPA: hypothetical protein VHW44_23125 [Pseudonocardiaceae bacterium]|jgi:hypothetical protein|nr:hypothetical protein [Pseudonocardiaceae bacterium]
MTAPLLNYLASAEPSPIQASTAQVSTDGRVNISVSSGEPVYCNEIEVAVPIGTDLTDLFTLSPAGSVSTNKWAITTVVKKGRELGLDNDDDYATFTYDCISPTDYLINYDLVFGVFGAVGTGVGDCDIAILENSGTTSDPTGFTTKTYALTVSKVAPRFYLQNVVATAVGTPTVPTTDFPLGTAIDLSWESNGTYFQLFAKGQTVPVYAGSATTFRLAGGLTRDTTFVLAASVTGTPGQETPQGGYQPIYLYDSLTVTVSNPSLQPSTVHVTGTLTADGRTILGVTQTGALTAASATVVGALGAADVTASGKLGVTGPTTLATTTANGPLTANAVTTLAEVTVNGRLTARRAPVALNGPARFIVGGASIAGAIQAFTDGFAVLQIIPPSAFTKSSFAYGAIQSGGPWFQVLGGTVGSFGANWSSVMGANPNSMCLPVQAGSVWQYSAGNQEGNQLNSTIQVYWYPMGGGSGEETYRELSESEITDLKLPPAPEIGTNPLAGQESAAGEFIERLEEIFERSIAGPVKAELAALLKRI